MREADGGLREETPRHKGGMASFHDLSTRVKFEIVYDLYHFQKIRIVCEISNYGPWCDRQARGVKWHIRKRSTSGIPLAKELRYIAHNFTDLTFT